ncbi:hypothetical protein IF2G_07339 [Cordyceps javanica]|nr:hypothetical protein IF2G_07339 [Cordyceps javanica]
MDLFAKAVKSGIAKGYAIGQQQLQQHLAKQRDSGVQSDYDNTSNHYGAQQNSSGNTAAYSQFQQQQPQPQQQYAAAYNVAPPPLPPRQYQPPQSQPNHFAPQVQATAQYLPASYESSVPARPEYSYNSIMPPPPPTYIPPAATEAAYSQYSTTPDPQRLSTAVPQGNIESREEHIRYFQQSSYEIRAGLLPIRPPLTPAVEDCNPRQQQIHVPPSTEAGTVGNMTGYNFMPPNQQLDSSSSCAAPPATLASDEARLQPVAAYEHTITNENNSQVSKDTAPEYSSSLSVEQQLSNLSLSAPPKVAEAEPRSQKKDKKRSKLPPMLADGTGLDNLRAFLSSRLLIPNCKGRATTTGPDGIKYYGMKDDTINGFIACEACFTDCIADTAFESQFEPYKHEQGKDNRWTCDASLPYIQKALASFSERNDWHGFIEGASRRFKTPACEGKETARADSGNWYTTRQKMDNFQVCEACYMDKIELDPFCAEFEQLPGSVDFDQYIEFLRQRWTCSLTSSSLPMMFALDAAENKDDFGAFYDSAAAIVKLVPCTKYGIIRGNWWTVTGGCENFDLCEACYEGIMKPNELDQFLEPKQRGPEETVICDFCPAAPRFDEYFNKFAETLDRGIFSCYADHIRTFAGVEACPGRESRAKAKWWGYGEALFCEHCYLVFVRQTPLSDHMPLQGEYDERAQICQIWSPRMRGMWRAACEAGAPGSAASDAELVNFRAFGTKRLDVWLQTVPRILFMRHMKDMKMMQAMQQGQLSLMYQGMNSMSVLSGADDGNWHGNNSIGWYETENGATGAQMFNNMQAGMADAARGDEWMQIFKLELIWKEVE